VPLLLLDLDNTLVDRAAAFRRRAAGFAASVGGAAAGADWLVTADRSPATGTSDDRPLMRQLRAGLQRLGR
jgi:putative hydrolase of the HAD superfamily